MPSCRRGVETLVKLSMGGALVLAAVAAVVAAAGHGVRVQDAASQPPGTVDFFTGTTHYAVPAKYHPAVTRYSEKRNYSALSLMLFLPDLSPAADHPEEMKRPGWHDQMTLLFEHGPRWGTADEQIAILTDKPRGVHTLPEPAANGCSVYRTPLMDPGDVYICPEDGSKIVFFCSRASDVPYPDCTMFENIGSDLGLICNFSAKYAPDAVSIDLRIKALVKAFSQP